MLLLSFYKKKNHSDSVIHIKHTVGPTLQETVADDKGKTVPVLKCQALKTYMLLN